MAHSGREFWCHPSLPTLPMPSGMIQAPVRSPRGDPGMGIQPAHAPATIGYGYAQPVLDAVSMQVRHQQRGLAATTSLLPCPTLIQDRGHGAPVPIDPLHMLGHMGHASPSRGRPPPTTHVAGLSGHHDATLTPRTLSLVSSQSRPQSVDGRESNYDPLAPKACSQTLPSPQVIASCPGGMARLPKPSSWERAEISTLNEPQPAGRATELLNRPALNQSPRRPEETCLRLGDPQGEAEFSFAHEAPCRGGVTPPKHTPRQGESSRRGGVTPPKHTPRQVESPRREVDVRCTPRGKSPRESPGGSLELTPRQLAQSGNFVITGNGARFGSTRSQSSGGLIRGLPKLDQDLWNRHGYGSETVSPRRDVSPSVRANTLYKDAVRRKAKKVEREQEARENEMVDVVEGKREMKRLLAKSQTSYQLRDGRSHGDREDVFLKRKEDKLKKLRGEQQRKAEQEVSECCTFKPKINRKKNGDRQSSCGAVTKSGRSEANPIVKVAPSTESMQLQLLEQQLKLLRDMADLDADSKKQQTAFVSRRVELQLKFKQQEASTLGSSADAARRLAEEALKPDQLADESKLNMRRLNIIHALEQLDAQVWGMNMREKEELLQMGYRLNVSDEVRRELVPFGLPRNEVQAQAPYGPDHAGGGHDRRIQAPLQTDNLGLQVDPLQSDQESPLSPITSTQCESPVSSNLPSSSSFEDAQRGAISGKTDGLLLSAEKSDPTTPQVSKALSQSSSHQRARTAPGGDAGYMEVLSDDSSNSVASQQTLLIDRQHASPLVTVAGRESPQRGTLLSPRQISPPPQTRSALVASAGAVLGSQQLGKGQTAPTP